MSRIRIISITGLLLGPLGSLPAATIPVNYVRDASAWDDQHGLAAKTDRVADDRGDGYGPFVDSCDNGDWLAYRGLHFGEGIYDSIVLFLAKDQSMGQGMVEVRLDGIGGTRLASVTPRETHCCFDFIYGPNAVALPRIQGDHDLYLVWSGGSSICRINKVTLKGSIATEPGDARTYYVATDGSDGNDGLSMAKPFRTIQHAAGVMKPGSTCLIRGGTYRETVSPVYTGAPGSPLTFAAYNNEAVVVSGADPVSGWSRHSGSIYKAAMPWTMGPGNNQVFVDGAAMWEARTPNVDLPIGAWVDEYAIKKGTGDGSDPFNVVLKYCALGQNPDEATRMTTASMGGSNGGLAEKAFDKPDGFFDGALFWSHGAWRPALGEIRRSRNTGDGQDFDIYQWCWMGNFNFGYVGGTLNLLDEAREWVRKDSTLYLWAPGGGDPSARKVEAKRRVLGFDLTGKSYVTLRGLRFFATSLTLRNADHCLIDRCQARYVSHFTIWSPDLPWPGADESSGFTGIYISGSDNEVRGSSIAYSAGSGIILNGLRNTVTESYIHHCNYSSTYDAGVNVIGGDSTRVERCDIHTMGRSCVNNGGQKVLYNRLHNAMLYSSEGGAIYTYGPGDFVYKGEEFAYNWFYDNMGSLAAAIVADGGGRANWMIHHNVIWRGASVDINPCNLCIDPNFNQAYNNTFLDSVTMLGNWEPATTANGLYYWRNGGAAYWKLKDVANNQFVPLDNSPAVDAGLTVIPAPVDDQGRPTMPSVTISDYAGKAPDLGAYESGRTPWVPGPTAPEPVWTYPVPDIGKDAVITGVSLNAGERFPTCAVGPAGLLLRGAKGMAYEVSVVDARGAVCMRRMYRDGGTQVVPLARMARGTYVVWVRAQGRVRTSRFMLVR